MQNKTVTKYVHIMKYMGSKRELLGQIEKIIEGKLKESQVLLDIFSGTCGVGIYHRDKYAIYSNDIQSYSKVISEGIIEAFVQKTTREKIWSLIEEQYNKNYNFVSAKLSKEILQSKTYKDLDEWDEKILKKYLQFIQSLPSPTSQDRKESAQHWLTKEYLKQNKSGKKFPYVQTTFLFSEMYFSIEQAIAIDSLKYAIDTLAPKYQGLKNVLNVALIHSYSYSSAGTGHFAQFRDLSTISSVKDVFIYRSKSVIEYFFRKVEEIIEASTLNKYHQKSRSFCKDFNELLSDEKIMKNVGLVYADPPYSFVHYSRFYHAIEDLCRYDYPIVEHKGRYRLDRHQSPFCIKSQAPTAFRDMLSKAAKFNVPVLISYSNTGMIKLGEVEKIAKNCGYKTKLVEIAHKHSTMGRLKDKDRDVTEALLLCH